MAIRDVARGAWDRTASFARRIFGSGTGQRADAPGDDKRGVRIGALDELYHAEQYDRRNLAPPWDKVPPGGDRQPLRFQRPAVIYALAKVIVDRPTSMLFGEGRFPRVSFELANPPPEEPPEPLDPEAGDPEVISAGVRRAKRKKKADPGAEVARWLSNLIDQGHLEAVGLTWARLGCSLGSGVMTWGYVDGVIEFTPHKAHHCEPTFHPRSTGPIRRLEKLEKRYRFDKRVLESIDGRTDRWVSRRYWHREVWTPTEHIVYRDEPADSDEEPAWVPEHVLVHGFGFVPAVWVKSQDDGDPGSIDGVSLLTSLPTLLESIDRTLTGQDRGVRSNTEPEKVYIGIPMDPNTKKPIAIGGGASTSLPTGGSAMLLEMMGDGLRVAGEHVMAQRGRALEVSRVTLPDPDKLLAASKSGAALRILFSPTLELVGELRSSYGAALRTILEQILRAAREGTLAKLPDEDGNPGTLALPAPPSIPAGKVGLLWGKYFAPTPEDLLNLSQAASALKAAGLLDTETLVRFLADDFGVRDVETLLDELEAQEAQNMAREAQQAKLLADADPPDPPKA